MKDNIKYAFYTIVHPMDGFYEISHRGKGNILLAGIIVFLFGVSFSFNRQYANFIVNDVNQMSINSIMEICAVVLLFMLFCISNWSITCLLDGEGKLKDIITISGYSMLPMVLVMIPTTLFSYLIAENEEVFYYLLLYASIIYFIILAVIGIMIVHNFTMGKTIIIIVLTFVAMFIILFLSLLLTSLLGQIVLFIKGLYDEMMLRA